MRAIVGRDRPVGIEHDVADRVAEHRRSVVGLADDDPGIQNRFRADHHLEDEIRHIDEYIGVAEIIRHPASPFHVEQDLLDSAGHRNVECRPRSLADGAVDVEAVAVLELPDRGLQHVVEILRLDGGRVEIAARSQAPSQGQNRGLAHTHLQGLAVGNRGPAAGGGNPAIFRQRRLQSLVVRAAGRERGEIVIEIVPAHGPEQFGGRHGNGMNVKLAVHSSRIDPSSREIATVAQQGAAQPELEIGARGRALASEIRRDGRGVIVER